MKIRNILKHIRAVCLPAAAALAAMAAMVACERGIYDYEGDCSVHYRIAFRYDMNLKWADAFASEVKSVRLFVYNEDGTLAAEYTDRGAHLSEPGYTMPLDMQPGKYHLVAWCGTDNEGMKEPQFEIPASTIGRSLRDEMYCRLVREQSDEVGGANSAKRLEFMFHGMLDVELPENEDGGDYLYTMPLTKDTNHIRIILQQLNAENLDVNKFGFRIDDANGYYAWNNDLLDDETIAYTPYARKSGMAGVGKEDLPGSRAIINVSGAIADLSVGRMMADRKNDMMLTITNDKADTVACVPVIQYALLAKDYYEEAYGRTMEDQEFLDREDDYVLTFFLDSSQRWEGVSILIHSWRVVVNDEKINQ